MAPGYIIVWDPPASCGYRICTEFNLSTCQGDIFDRMHLFLDWWLGQRWICYTSGVKSECSRLEQSSLIKCLVTKKCKPCEIYRLLGLVLWHINHCRLYNAKSSLDVHFLFLSWGIILWIELPWPENPANSCAWHTETLDCCFNLIRSHQQCIPWFPPLEIEPATTECRAKTLLLSHQSISPDFLVVVIQFTNNSST